MGTRYWPAAAFALIGLAAAGHGMWIAALASWLGFVVALFEAERNSERSEAMRRVERHRGDRW